MGRNVKLALIVVATIILVLLAGKCAYGAGEWIGGH
jgi:hypothetical protein